MYTVELPKATKATIHSIGHVGPRLGSTDFILPDTNSAFVTL
jgi:hypothetical protein